MHREYIRKFIGIPRIKGSGGFFSEVACIGTIRGQTEGRGRSDGAQEVIQSGISNAGC